MRAITPNDSAPSPAPSLPSTLQILFFYTPPLSFLLPVFPPHCLIPSGLWECPFPGVPTRKREFSRHSTTKQLPSTWRRPQRLSTRDALKKRVCFRKPIRHLRWLQTLRPTRQKWWGVGLQFFVTRHFLQHGSRKPEFSWNKTEPPAINFDFPTVSERTTRSKLQNLNY